MYVWNNLINDNCVSSIIFLLNIRIIFVCDIFNILKFEYKKIINITPYFNEL